MKHSLKWRLGALTFIVIGLIFVVFEAQIEYLLDASGVTGKTPNEDIGADDVPDGMSPASQGNGKSKPKPKGIRTVPVPSWNGLACIRAKSPVSVDASSSDWSLLGGRFLCNDCGQNHSTESAWMHTMFDDENFYLFSRVRHPEGLKSELSPKEKTTDSHFIQVRLVTDLATAINLWRGENGRGVVQLHYFMPKKYPRKIEKSDDDLFTADDAIHREDGLAKGVKLKVLEHADQRGADFECAIPWSLLCREDANRPKTGSEVKMAFGARLASGGVIHELQEKTNKSERMYLTYLIDGKPSVPPVIDVMSTEKPKGRRVFPVVLAEDKNRLEVDWSRSFGLNAVRVPSLLVTPVKKTITIDGADDEWPKSAETVISEAVNQRYGAAVFKAAADSENFYVHANVSDVTPEGNANSLTLKLKTGGTKTLVFGMDSLTVDGEDALASGAKAATAIDSSYLSYTIEAAIPWRLLTESGEKPKSFAITGEISLNPLWRVSGLNGNVPVETDDGGQEFWTLAQLVDEIPQKRVPTMFVNGMCFDSEIGNPKVRYGQGVTLRFPHATWNPDMDVIGGTPTVDGAFDDWDLSGGIFLCNDLDAFSNSHSAWFHAMYDSKNLYLLYRVTDRTPMINPTPTAKDYRNGDGMELRIHVGDQDFCWVGVAMPDGTVNSFVKVGPKVVHTPELDPLVKGRAKMRADGTGYVMEVAIPWSCMKGIEAPPKTGENYSMYTRVKTSGAMRLSDPTSSPSVIGAVKMPEYFGKSHYREKGPVTPRACQLANGLELPVVMRDGKPQLDLSPLD